MELPYSADFVNPGFYRNALTGDYVQVTKQEGLSRTILYIGDRAVTGEVNVIQHVLSSSTDCCPGSIISTPVTNFLMTVLTGDRSVPLFEEVAITDLPESALPFIVE